MNSRFKISETLTTEDWEAFNVCLLSRKTGRVFGTATRMVSAIERPNKTFLGILLIAVGVFCLYSTTLFIGVENAMVGAGPALFLGCSCLFFGIRTFRRRKDSSFAAALPKYRLIGVPTDFTFEDDAFFILADSGSSSYRYHVISDVWEDKTIFCLFGAGIQYILRKDAFTQGDPEQFREFIAQKTGKEVEFVK